MRERRDGMGWGEDEERRICKRGGKRKREVEKRRARRGEGKRERERTETER